MPEVPITKNHAGWIIASILLVAMAALTLWFYSLPSPLSAFGHATSPWNSPINSHISPGLCLFNRGYFPVRIKSAIAYVGNGVEFVRAEVIRTGISHGIAGIEGTPADNNIETRPAEGALISTDGAYTIFFVLRCVGSEQHFDRFVVVYEHLFKEYTLVKDNLDRGR